VGSPDFRNVSAPPGALNWLLRGGVESDGRFFPNVVPVGAAITAAVLVTIGLLEARVTPVVTPVRIVAAVVALVPFVLDFLPVRCDRRLMIVLAIPAVYVIAQTSDNAGNLLLCFLAGEVATSGTLPESLGALVASSAAIAVHSSHPHVLDSPHAWDAWWAGVFAAWAGGRVVSRQLRLVAKLRQAQASLATRVATEERQRIAREVHDVIAHSLTVTMLHLTGARLTLEHDPAAVGEAIAALNEAERQGRQSLTDIRHTVGLLASDPDAAATAPLPGATELEALVAGYRSAGLAADLDLSGDPSVVSLATGLGLYRIIQESLTNAAKHAPDAVTQVTVAVDPIAVRFTVRTLPATRGQRQVASSTTGGGLGVRGMRNRAELLGGSLSAGPTDDGGWEVRGTLPAAAVVGAGADEERVATT
jgi:signal transduction histidine kinase